MQYASSKLNIRGFFSLRNFYKFRTSTLKIKKMNQINYTLKTLKT